MNEAQAYKFGFIAAALIKAEFSLIPRETEALSREGQSYTSICGVTDCRSEQIVSVLAYDATTKIAVFRFNHADTSRFNAVLEAAIAMHQKAELND